MHVLKKLTLFFFLNRTLKAVYFRYFHSVKFLTFYLLLLLRIHYLRSFIFPLFYGASLNITFREVSSLY